MRKLVKVKNSDDESHDKQPGCMWGLVHVLDYHHWHSNVRKIVHHRKYEGDWSPETNLYTNDAYEAEMLLGEEQKSHLSTKVSRTTKKQSLRARIKAKIVEEISKENKKKGGARGISCKPNLQRTYSIHHLESVDDDLGKICTDWKHPIIFFPKDAENGSSQSFDTTRTTVVSDLVDSRGEHDVQSPKDAGKLESREAPDVFEIFMVDKELVLKHMKDSDGSIAGFSRSAFGFNTEPKFSKSRSFPVAGAAQNRKLKPIKLESKQKEVWSSPREKKFQPFEEVSNRKADNATERINERHVKDGVRKHAHRRSSSLNESLDKYARLFENISGKDTKLHSSKSLKLTNDHGLAPPHFTRIRSLSYVDSYYSNLNLEVLADDPSGNSSDVIAKLSISGHESTKEENIVSIYMSNEQNASVDAKLHIEEDCESLSRNGEFEMVDGLIEDREKDTNCTDVGLLKLHNQSIVLDEYHAGETQISKGLEHVSVVEELSSSIATNDLETNHPNLENDVISDKIANSEQSDLDYVRYILEQSGIALDAPDASGNSFSQLFSPQFFEEIEARWPHEQFELTGQPDFYGCWHHQMVFGLVSEVLLEIHNISAPYYPKALSSSCQVRPFPMGDHFVEEICKSIGTLVEKQSLDDIFGRDLAHDRSWMNLQLESEYMSLEVEDMIFNELLQEVICS